MYATIFISLALGFLALIILFSVFYYYYTKIKIDKDTKNIIIYFEEGFTIDLKRREVIVDQKMIEIDSQMNTSEVTYNLVDVFEKNEFIGDNKDFKSLLKSMDSAKNKTDVWEEKQKSRTSSFPIYGGSKENNNRYLKFIDLLKYDKTQEKIYGTSHGFVSNNFDSFLLRPSQLKSHSGSEVIKVLGDKNKETNEGFYILEISIDLSDRTSLSQFDVTNEILKNYGESLRQYGVEVILTRKSSLIFTAPPTFINIPIDIYLKEWRTFVESTMQNFIKSKKLNKDFNAFSLFMTKTKSLSKRDINLGLMTLSLLREKTKYIKNYNHSMARKEAIKTTSLINEIETKIKNDNLGIFIDSYKDQNKKNVRVISSNIKSEEYYTFIFHSAYLKYRLLDYLIKNVIKIAKKNPETVYVFDFPLALLQQLIDLDVNLPKNIIIGLSFDKIDGELFIANRKMIKYVSRGLDINLAVIANKSKDIVWETLTILSEKHVFFTPKFILDSEINYNSQFLFSKIDSSAHQDPNFKISILS